MPRDKLMLRHRSALLERLLDEPNLSERVKELPARALARAIQHIGLEDAAQLVACASPEQLSAIFDEELWTSDADRADETFDAERFGLWLSILVESGAAFAVQKLLALDEDFLTMALSSQMLVLDMELLATRMSRDERGEEDDALDKQLDAALHLELEQYRVVARNAQHWEALLTVLCELHEQHFARFCILLERCCALSSSYIEDNGGLYDVLSELESLAADVAGAREERREEQGYVAPSTAKAFLRLALQTEDKELLESRDYDYLTRAHFRALARAQPVRSARLQGAADGSTDALDELLSLSAEKTHSRALPALPRDVRHAAGLRSALQALRGSAPELYQTRMSELAYLSNVALSGLRLDGDRLDPAQAFEVAVALCELGWARVRRSTNTRERAAPSVQELSLITLFQLGVRAWSSARRSRSHHPLLRRLDAPSLEVPLVNGGR